VLLALIGMTAVMPTAWLALPEVARITIETRRSLTSNLVLKQQDPIDGPVEHVLVLLEKLFFSETEYYQDPDWSTFEAVNAQVAACKASTLCGRQNNVLWGVSLSILSALGLWGMIARWRGSETLLLLLWLMVPILILGTINALPWQRYYNVLYAQLGLLVGVGVRQAWRLIASQIPRTTLTAAELE
jgi:4-amino-4-deoxy-L-arabinose transferase-like glycosyltransferase